MSLTVLVVYFLLFSFIGWIIDTTYSSFSQGHFVSSGYFKYLPFCPLYGFGGLAIFYSHQFLAAQPLILQIFLGWIFLNLVEYLGGLFCLYFLKERLWDYSHRHFNLQGHLDLLHSVFWLLISIIFSLYLTPFFDTFYHFLNRHLYLPQPSDISLIIIFITLLVIGTLLRRRHRLNRLFLR